MILDLIHDDFSYLNFRTQIFYYCFLSVRKIRVTRVGQLLGIHTLLAILGTGVLPLTLLIAFLSKRARL